MQPTLAVSMWVALPNEVRHRIRALFNIPRSAATEVNDGVVVSDGTTFYDLKILTTEKMQEFLGIDSTDFHKLFDQTVARIVEDMNGIKKQVVVASDDAVTVIIEPKRRVRPRKNATKE